MWLAILLITLSSFVLSLEDITSFAFSWGAILVILATVCWGFENNCTRILAAKKSAHYSITPLIGTFLPFLIFQETLEWSYFLGLSIMVIGTIIVVADTLAKENQ